MNRYLIMGLSILLGASAVVLARPRASDPATVTTQQSQAGASVGQQEWGFFSKYCENCHNVTDWAGGVAFDTLTPGDVPTQGEIFEHVVSKLQGRLMPPAGKPQPPKAAVHAMVSWLETTLDKAAASRPMDPGRVALHRLNRKEYANAIWDLLRVRVDPTAILPPDDRGDGFDNIASVLQVSPDFLDEYFTAARSIAIQAVGEIPSQPSSTRYYVKNAGSQEFHEPGLPLGTRGGMVVTHWFPADGDYVLNISNMAVALWVFNMEFRNKVVALLDGKEFWSYTVGGEEQMKAIDQKQDPAVDAINKHLKGIHFHATAGPHQLAVTFVHRTYAESEARLYSQIPGAQDRVLRLQWIEVTGPFHPTGISETPSRQRIFICHPASTADETPCARKILASLATKAFRRPVTTQDMNLLMGFYQQGRKAKDFDEGIRRGLTAILASPYFLYRVEHAPALLQVKNGPVVRRLSDLELASRLSFFLWSSEPDDQLLKLAEANKLHEPDVLHAQVRRMLADPRAQTLASNFAFQWLGIPRLAEIKPDPKIFPYAGDPRDDYRTELKMFVNSIFQGNRDVMDLLTANYTFVNQRLALLYGINNVRGDRFRKVVLTNSARFGLLGKGAILMATSYPTRTAPVLRGEWILDNITGTPPAAPPPSVPSLKENQTGEVAHTIRELMALHRNKPSCFACHGLLDPLGFAMENFDAVGVWRTKDRMAGTPIDASGVLPDGTKVNGVDDLRRALVADPTQFVQTLTEKLMIFATGRGLTWRDMPTIRAIVRDTARDHYRFWSIVMHIVDSDQFQMRTWGPPAASSSHLTQTALNLH